PMPITVQVTQASGKTEIIKLPVEVWHHGSQWTFKVNTTEKISSVVIDPKKRLPDVNEENNTWSGK
ncbi:MAG TPA: hypothetical protein VKA92_10035, partial [Segetibacter sp.]|nr:hypothetical protein [Segetibacter sp.]